MKGLATGLEFYADFGALLLSPFSRIWTTVQDDQEEEAEQAEIADQDEDWNEQFELLQGLAHTTVETDKAGETQDADARHQLFQVMVSMGIIEFTTQGYSFKLEPHVTVSPLCVAPTESQ